MFGADENIPPQNDYAPIIWRQFVVEKASKQMDKDYEVKYLSNENTDKICIRVEWRTENELKTIMKSATQK